MLKQENWYVVYTYPNTERKVYNELGKREITAFLPTTRVTRQWSDRKKEIEVPLFPNYVFVRLTPKELWVVAMLNGVVNFISFNGAPAVVKDTEISLVRKIVTGCGPVSREPVIANGERVQVMHGPLAGLRGKVTDRKGITRLYVELETINQTLAISIDAALLHKVE